MLESHPMSNSIGARLRQARELRRLTLPQVSDTTKLRTHYLQALENDDYSAIPSAAQARGFLRIYAEFLELDLESLLPPAAVAQPPAAAVLEAPQAAAPGASGGAGLLATLRKRLARPRKESEPQAAPAAAPAESPSMVASSEAETAPHLRPKPGDVKKNSIS